MTNNVSENTWLDNLIFFKGLLNLCLIALTVHMFLTCREFFFIKIPVPISVLLLLFIYWQLDSSITAIKRIWKVIRDGVH